MGRNIRSKCCFHSGFCFISLKISKQTLTADFHPLPSKVKNSLSVSTNGCLSHSRLSRCTRGRLRRSTHRRNRHGSCATARAACTTPAPLGFWTGWMRRRSGANGEQQKRLPATRSHPHRWITDRSARGWQHVNASASSGLATPSLLPCL